MATDLDSTATDGGGPQRLITAYDQYFHGEVVVDERLLEEALRLRYQVYCVENPFENADEHPDGLERDAYDPQSLHAILIHRPTGVTAGTVRLILPALNGHARSLPIRSVCDHPLLDDDDIIPSQRSCEISRFAVSKAMRRRAEDRGTRYGALSEPSPSEPRRVIPHPCLGLMAAMVRMTRDAGMTHVTAVMEPALLRMLARLGIHFFPLGPTVNYHGVRQPCHSNIDLLLARAWLERREVWEVLTRNGHLHPVNERLVDALRTEAGGRAATAERALELQMDRRFLAAL